jgi:hypothetical protein
MTRLTDALGEYAMQVGLAATGGLIGILMRDEPGGWPHMLLGAVGAGFVGLLIAHGCHALGLSDDFTFVCVGVGGWFGAERTLSLLERYLLKRFNITGDSGESGADNVRSIEDELRKRERGGKP